MATLAYALTTEARIKDRLGLSASDATRDTVIKRMMYACTDFIEKTCGGRRFKRQTISQELYDGSPFNSQKKDNIIILKNAPVIAGQTITVEYNAGTFASPSWVAFASGDIAGVDYDAGIIYLNSGLPVGSGNIRVSYTAGYLIDFANEFNDTNHTLPNDISDLCDRLTTRLFKKRESEGRDAEGFQASQITWGSFLKDEDKTIIANYSRNQFV